MRVSRRVLPLLVLAASLLALWPVARGAAQTTEADVHVAQAIIAIDERRYDAALAELKRALEIEPDHVEALYYTGVVYAAQRRVDHARVVERLDVVGLDLERALQLRERRVVPALVDRDDGLRDVHVGLGRLGSAASDRPEREQRRREDEQGEDSP